MTRPDAPPPANILEAMASPDWWGPWFSHGDWTAWRTFLAAAFGLPLPDGTAELFTACTGLTEPPTARAAEAYAIIGRRGGKTRLMSLIAAWLAAFEDWRPFLSKGETASILLASKDREQAGIAFNHIESLFVEHPTLKRLVKDSSAGLLELKNQVTIRVAAASFRGMRGFSVAGVLADELGFWFEGETSLNPAEEILRALRPATLQFKGRAMILGCSSPYKRQGPLWEAYRDFHGKPGPILTWLAPTEVMHPLSPEERAQIERERDRDPEGAAAEYDCVWRDDIAGFLDEALIEKAIDPGVTIRPPRPELDYAMTIDPSGGRGDSFAAAVGHVQDGLLAVDVLYEKKAPFAPSEVMAEIGELARRYRVTRVRTDAYGAGLVVDALKQVGLLAEVSDRTTSDTYLAAVPTFAEGVVRLPDDRQLVHQLTSLQRRTGATGKQQVVHPRAAHDDLAAAVCGLLVMLASDARPTLIDTRRLEDAVAELKGRHPIGLMGTLWITVDGRYGWVIVASCNPRWGDMASAEMVVLDYGEGAWSWSVLDDVAGRLDALAEDTWQFHPGKTRGQGMGAVMLVQDQLQGPAVRALEKAFRDRVGRFDWERRRIGADAIEQAWATDLSGLLLTVSALVGSGRVRQTAALKARSKPSSLFRLLAVKAGERIDDDPLRMAQLICYAQLSDALPAPRGGAQLALVA